MVWDVGWFQELWRGQDAAVRPHRRRAILPGLAVWIRLILFWEPWPNTGILTGGVPILGTSPFKPNGLVINPDVFRAKGLEFKGTCELSYKELE